MPETLRILVCSYLEPECVQRIADEPDVEVMYAPELLPPPEFPCDHHGSPRELDGPGFQRWHAMLADADVCFDFDWERPVEMPRTAPRVRWVQATSAGIGGFMERTGLARWSATVTTAAGVHAQPLAEWAVTGVLHFVKDIPRLQRLQSEHRWERTAVEGLAGRRALVVGLGSIGRAIGSALSCLGVDVWGAGRPGRAYELPAFSRVGDTSGLVELLADCDVLVLACPLTRDTEGLIGHAELDALGPEGILVNVARGQVVDEDALVSALRAGRLRGAVLDVAAQEPLPAASPLWDLDRVLICPHSAATLRTENAALVDLFVDNLRRWRRGEPLRNTYEPERGY